MQTFKFPLSFSRKRYNVFSAVSKLIDKTSKFRTQSHVKIEEKLAPYLEVCDISIVKSPAVEKSSPLSPKRPESPVMLEEMGRGKR